MRPVPFLEPSCGRAAMNRPKRILVYGFGPYRRFRENITAKIVRSLPRAAGLKRIVFRVRFDRGQFIKALSRHKPEVVLGLGQSTRRTIDFETRAANRRRGGQKTRARAIRQRGPRWLPATLDIELDRSVKRSSHAGDYVCNFSMYVMLDQIQRAQAKTQFGFLHLPHDLALHEGSQVVAGVLEKLAWRSGTFARVRAKPGSEAGAPSPT